MDTWEEHDVKYFCWPPRDQVSLCIWFGINNLLDLWVAKGGAAVGMGSRRQQRDHHLSVDFILWRLDFFFFYLYRELTWALSSVDQN